MKILIVEDEPVNARELSQLIKAYDPVFNILAIIDTIEATVQFLKSQVPDLLFLDIELADGSAFEIFRQIEITCPVVFVTAYDEYALQAFDQNSIAYLLKPITKLKLQEAFEHFRNMKSAVIGSGEYLKMVNSLRFKENFLVKFGNQLIPISTSQIAYFYSENTIVYVVSYDNHKYVSNHTLMELEDLLDPKVFFRVNRQYLVHQSSIVSLIPHLKGQVLVRLTHCKDDRIIVSRQRTVQLKTWLS